jgi:hypothetical protein
LKKHIQTLDESSSADEPVPPTVKVMCGVHTALLASHAIGFGALVKAAFRSGSGLSQPPLSRVRANLAVTVRQLKRRSNKVKNFPDDLE